jgi:hypothetical protein
MVRVHDLLRRQWVFMHFVVYALPADPPSLSDWDRVPLSGSLSYNARYSSEPVGSQMILTNQ